MKLFNSDEFGQIRVISKEKEPWFIGKDIAKALGYERATKAISDHVDLEDRDEVPIQDSIGRMQKTPVINESGLYSLIFNSKLPTAKKFKRWVTSEVLPSIRKHGGYVAGQEDMSNEELLARALSYVNSKLEEKNKEIEVMTPKVTGKGQQYFINLFLKEMEI